MVGGKKVFKMKDKKAPLLISLVFLFMSSANAETPALDNLLKQRLDALDKSQETQENLNRLNEEKKYLIDKLVDLNKQYDEIEKTQTKATEMTPVSIDMPEITDFLKRKKMGRCKFSVGEYKNEYIIQKDKVKIRFAFLSADSILNPKISLVRGDRGQELLQIEQPGYDPDAINLKGEIHAIIRFTLNQRNGKPDRIVHAVFMGQRIYDKWFGQSSSYALTNITCVLGR